MGGTGRPPTSRDLARLAGVSQATVSRVLTNSPRVSPDTRARVLQVLKDANYTPNALARAMKTGRTDTIGVFMTRVTSPFHAALLDEIGRLLSEVGLHMILWNIEHDPEETVSEVIQQRLVDGFILTSATYDSKLHSMAMASGTPTVLLHRGIDGLDCDQVVGDNWQGAFDAGRYLVEAGHRDIGLVTLEHTGNTSRDRDLGFRAALAEAGVPIKERNEISTGVSHDHGHAAAVQLLSAEQPPTAIYTVTDLLAFGLLDGARAQGVKVPEDVWVIGFDNTDLASWEAFDLTSVNQPIHAIVEQGIDLLRRRIGDPAAETTIINLPCQLVVRGSTANTVIG
ncbi:LacI family transcriptional regulator [Kribbella orskensis]|uniref:LacI family transcriptional regulator n=1 Tax=Kribbella orskensis TaxID=2512216 RepID=A0ABY2BLY4_9ACTN|nr:MULTISPECIES: LacI family DNA-binding transcriptional regulator [Kribbella]TCN41153.1 LacI family transcriptional regulator [Kribbella sp. VKM Ac-2500]TCO24405.1 LacI family transcriptional regulator [Kribbella orskensis]